MPRGRACTQQEISCLLALIKGSGEATLLMASTSRPNEALWRELSQGLAATGYGRNVAQCRSKWKALKQAGRPVFGERCLPGNGDFAGSVVPCPGLSRLSVPDLVNLPPGKRRPRLEAQPPSSPGHVIHTRPPSALGQSTKSEPASLSSGLVAAAMDEASQMQTAPSAVPNAGPPFAPLPTLGKHPPAFAAFPPIKQESADREAVILLWRARRPRGRGQVSGRCQSPSETRAHLRQELAVSTPCCVTRPRLQTCKAPSVVSQLRSTQQLLVQTLRTAQQVLLESLACDTLSHLHLISENLVQVGETLHELLLQAHARSANLPTPLSHYAPPPAHGAPLALYPQPPSQFPRPQRGTCGAIRLWFPPPPAAPPETWCT
ncbi:unnamed protein product [Natator depressus]